MRILLVNDSPLVGSGSGTTTVELGRALLRAGNEVRCLLLADRPDVTAPFPVRTVVASQQNSAAALPFDFPAWTWHPATRNTYAQLADEHFHHLRHTLRSELDREVCDFDPQIIHCQHAGLFAHLALESGVPYVVSAHAASLRVTCQDSRLRPLAQQVVENAAAVIASSEHLADQVRQGLADVEVRLKVVLPELTPDALEPSEPLGPGRMPAGLGFPTREGPLVVFAGTLVPRHGAATLVNAAAIYECVHPTLRTVIIGDGPQRDELRVQAERLKLERIHFLGWQPRTLVRTLLAEAATAVVPSHGAPSTWVMLEALTGGTPIIASTGDGREELLPPDAGTLVPPDDHELLAEAVLRGFAEGRMASQGPLHALRAAQKIDSERWVREIIAIYEQSLRDRGQST